MIDGKDHFWFDDEWILLTVIREWLDTVQKSTVSDEDGEDANNDEDGEAAGSGASGGGGGGGGGGSGGGARVNGDDAEVSRGTEANPVSTL